MKTVITTFSIFILISVMGPAVFAQGDAGSQADRLKELQRQLDEAQRKVGNEDDADYRLISENTTEQSETRENDPKTFLQ